MLIRFGWMYLLRFVKLLGKSFGFMGLKLALLFTLTLVITAQVQAGVILNASTVQKGSSPLTGDDDQSDATPIGFTFNFYGADYTQFWANTNGVMFFAGPNTGYDNKATLSDHSIAPLWDDLKSYHGSDATKDDFIFYTVVGSAPNRQGSIAVPPAVPIT